MSAAHRSATISHMLCGSPAQVSGWLRLSKVPIRDRSKPGGRTELAASAIGGHLCSLVLRQINSWTGGRRAPRVLAASCLPAGNFVLSGEARWQEPVRERVLVGKTAGKTSGRTPALRTAIDRLMVFRSIPVGRYAPSRAPPSFYPNTPYGGRESLHAYFVKAGVGLCCIPLIIS